MQTYVSTANTAFAAMISTFLKSVTSQLNETDQRITTNQRVNSMRDDAVAYIMSDKLNRNAHVLRSVVHDDLEQAIAIFGIGEDTLKEIRTIFTDMAELAADAASDSPSTSRSELDAMFTQLKTQITNKLAAARYNGVQIFSGVYDSGTTGTDLSILYTADLSDRLTLRVNTTTIGTLGVSGLDISTKTNAQNAYTSLTSTASSTYALSKLNAVDGKMASKLEIVQNAHNFAEVQASNYESAATSMTEADMVYEVARQTALQIRQQAAISVLSQGNLRQQYILNLLPNITNWS